MVGCSADASFSILRSMSAESRFTCDLTFAYVDKALARFQVSNARDFYPRPFQPPRTIVVPRNVFGGALSMALVIRAEVGTPMKHADVYKLQNEHGELPDGDLVKSWRTASIFLFPKAGSTSLNLARLPNNLTATRRSIARAVHHPPVNDLPRTLGAGFGLMPPDHAYVESGVGLKGVRGRCATIKGTAPGWRVLRVKSVAIRENLLSRNVLSVYTHLWTPERPSKMLTDAIRSSYNPTSLEAVYTFVRANTAPGPVRTTLLEIVYYAGMGECRAALSAHYPARVLYSLSDEKVYRLMDVLTADARLARYPQWLRLAIGDGADNAGVYLRGLEVHRLGAISVGEPSDDELLDMQIYAQFQEELFLHGTLARRVTFRDMSEANKREQKRHRELVDAVMTRMATATTLFQVDQPSADGDDTAALYTLVHAQAQVLDLKDLLEGIRVVEEADATHGLRIAVALNESVANAHRSPDLPTCVLEDVAECMQGVGVVAGGSSALITVLRAELFGVEALTRLVREIRRLCTRGMPALSFSYQENVHAAPVLGGHGRPVGDMDLVRTRPSGSEGTKRRMLLRSLLEDKDVPVPTRKELEKSTLLCKLTDRIVLQLLDQLQWKAQVFRSGAVSDAMVRRYVENTDVQRIIYRETSEGCTISAGHRLYLRDCGEFITVQEVGHCYDRALGRRPTTLEVASDVDPADPTAFLVTTGPTSPLHSAANECCETGFNAPLTGIYASRHWPVDGWCVAIDQYISAPVERGILLAGKGTTWTDLYTFYHACTRDVVIIYGEDFSLGRVLARGAK